MKPWLARPVVARLLEPVAWTTALLVVLSDHATIDGRRIALLGLVYAAARLITDTAPNLVVGPRLEAKPYAEHVIRQSLARVKLTLGLLSMLFAFGVVRALDIDLGLSTLHWLIGLPIVLASHAVALPVVREHRGVPVARPNIGPATGAIVFLGFAVFAHFGHHVGSRFEPIQVASIAIVVSNVVVGAIQRLVAAARKFNRPGYSFIFADLGALDRNSTIEDDKIAYRVATLVPFLVLPLIPAGLDLAFDSAVDPRLVVLATFAATLPPLLFDAKRRTFRFRFTAYGIAAALGLAWFAGGFDPQHRSLLAVAAFVMGYPAINALVDLGARRSLITLLLVYLLAKTFVALRFSGSNWPLAEFLFALLAMAAALEQDSKRHG